MGCPGRPSGGEQRYGRGCQGEELPHGNDSRRRVIERGVHRLCADTGAAMDDNPTYTSYLRRERQNTTAHGTLYVVSTF